MDFLEIQNAVKKGAFAESDRDDIKRWINQIYGELWNFDPGWTFTLGDAEVTVTAGDTEVTEPPEDFAAVEKLFRDDGCKLHAIDFPTFVERYQSTGAGTGAPEEYAVFAGTLHVGPAADADSDAYRLLYEKRVTLLDADDDEPAIPADLHQLLVDGAKAEGLMQGDPSLAAVYRSRFDRGIAAATVKYRRESADVPRHWPQHNI